MFGKPDKVECIFIGIYLMEQVVLILLYNFKQSLLPVWIGLFPAIFLTTIAFEKVLLKSDFKNQMEDLFKIKEKEKERDDEFKFTKNKFFGIKK